MEFLVKFALDIPDGVADSEVEDRARAEAVAAETLAEEGHLVRLWQVSTDIDPTTVLGLYRAASKAQLDALLGALPMYEWMQTSITPLVQHRNDPARIQSTGVDDSVGTVCIHDTQHPVRSAW
jgi:muconolactone delta-isomerase